MMEEFFDHTSGQIMRLLSILDCDDGIIGSLKNNQGSIQSYPPLDESNFVYNDCDRIDKEIAEIYSYGENIEHVSNYKAFEEFLDLSQYASNWQQLDQQQKIDIILKLNEKLEINDNSERMKLYRCILYIVQGCWNYIPSIEALVEEQKNNALLLYRYGIFDNLIKLLYLEKNSINTPMKRKNLRTTRRLRVIFSTLNTIIEYVRNDNQLRDGLKYDLLNPENDEFLIVTLFDMIVDFVNDRNQFSYYPIKKILILLWKLILITFGDLNDAKRFKCEQRKKYDLIGDHDECVENKQLKGKLRPKLSQQNYVKILNKIRLKYIGYTIENDSTTLTGLPDCIIESIRILQKHLYTPLSEKHVEQEKSINKHYNKQEDYELNSIELLYTALLPKLTTYIGSLTKIFLKLLGKSFNDINLKPYIVEILPTQMHNTETELLILTLDTRRHQEIMFKAISSILLLFLKHFKTNHFYQFECLCNILIERKFVNIINKFIRDNLKIYVDTPNEIDKIEFPLYIINRFDNPNTVQLESHYQWRQLFICINVLRILNKIVKYRPQLIALMVRQGVHNDLKQNLQINNRMLRIYSMKLVKLQIPYLRRQWIRDNLNIISGIYHYVRYHLLDDFLKRTPNSFGCIQLHDDQLKIALEKFHKRRYTIIINKNDNVVDMDNEDDYQPVDNCLQSVLGQPVQLCPIFKQHYETWLEYKVFKQDPDRFIL